MKQARQLVVSGSQSDVTAMEQYEHNLPSGTILTADKAYTSYALEDLLLEQDKATLLPLRKGNLNRQHDPIQKRTIKSFRKIACGRIISCNKHYRRNNGYENHSNLLRLL